MRHMRRGPTKPPAPNMPIRRGGYRGSARAHLTRKGKHDPDTETPARSKCCADREALTPCPGASKPGNREAMASGGTKLRLAVLRRDGYLCQSCKRNGKCRAGNEVHHIVPRARGGTDDDSNLETLCHACHLQSDAKARGRKVSKPDRVALDGTLIEDAR